MIHQVNSAISYRLDRYLKKLYPTLTQGVLEKALRLKQIKVNELKAQASLRVVHNDKIFIADRLNLESISDTKIIFSDSVIKLAHKITKDYLIYENEYFFAINKPSGLPTQGGSKINLSIDDALNYLNQEGNNLRLVHRLDKDTSGILLIAKDYLASTQLAKAFQEKIIKKTYLAIVVGKPEKDSGTISAMIGKIKGAVYETVGIDEQNGKLAVTHYKLLKPLDNGLSLIEFTPVTGRMHQLRFHAKLLGCPIVGDRKYGSIEVFPSKHMLLHAFSIILPEEIFGEEIILEAKLPTYIVSDVGL